MSSAGGGGGSGGYAYYRQITISSGQVPSTQSNFPVLVRGTYSYLATAANGGHVQSSAGVDIKFTSDAAGNNLLPYEQEKYVGATGEIAYWVQLPSAYDGASFYMFYGKANAVDESNKSGVWDSSFELVAHLGNGATLSGADSTANAHNGAIVSATAAAGQVDGGAGFDGGAGSQAHAYIDFGNATDLNGVSALTICSWVKGSSTDSYQHIVEKEDYLGGGGWTFQINDGGVNPIFLIGSGGGAVSMGYTTSNPVQLGVQNHVCAVYDGAQTGNANRVRIYVDKVQQTLTFSGTIPASSGGSTNPALLAKPLSDSGDSYFGGVLDEVEVSTSARSSDWIATEYNNQSAPDSFYSIGCENGGCGGSGYAHFRTVTIDHTKVPNSDRANFPVLVSFTNASLATTANGGHVQNSNGYDIVFGADSSCSSLLVWEMETYTASTGEILAWVQAPTVSHSSDTTLYMCYGKSGVSTFQGNAGAVWDSNFELVAHLGNGATLNASDSTTNAHNGTITSAAAAAGQVDGGASFDGGAGNQAHAYIDFGNAADLNSVSALTICSWIKGSSTGSFQHVLEKEDYGGGGGWTFQINDAGVNPMFLIGSGGGAVYNGHTTASPLSLNAWNHVCVVYDGSQSGNSSRLQMYVNGVLQTLSFDGAIPGTSGANTNPVLLTKPLSDSGDSYFGGVIDEVEISTAARSGDWIQTQYNNQSSAASFFTLGPEQ